MTAGKAPRVRYSFQRLADDLRHYRMEIVGLLVVCWGLASLAAVLGISRGVLISAFSDWLWHWFGIGAPAVAVSLIAAGVVLAAGRRLGGSLSAWQRVAGLALVWIACLLMADVFSRSGAGPVLGGRLGATVGLAARTVAGPALQWGVVLAAAFAGVHLAMGLSMRETVLSALRLLWAGLLHMWRQTLSAVVDLRRSLVERDVPPALAPETAVAVPRRARRRLPAIGVGEPEPTTEAAAPAPAAVTAAETGVAAPVLPPIDVFDPPSAEGSTDVDDGLQAAIIEETLAGFGIPAKVMQVEHGPAVTRFGVEPGYLDQASGGSLVRRKVRVNKIKTLTDDLALALAAAPIRVEAPIPGRPLVGIEVPNSAVAAVGMRDILEGPEFRAAKGGLRIALGRDISGRPVVVSLEKMPHLLIAGATGSGKSACIGALLASLLYTCTPADLRLLLIDPKRVELLRYRGVPHLLGKPEVDVEGAIAALRWACKQMDDRYKLFAGAGARDLATYNARMVEGGEPLPRIVIVIDELADLMLTSPDEVERSICRLAQMARATGIHLVLSTQRPSVDVVTGLIKANVPARIAFAVSSQMDSRVILDTPGAEALIGRGDMLYMPPDSSKLVRLQGTYVTEDETRRLVSFWQGQIGDGQVMPVCPWSAMLENEEEDEMLGQAATIAREADTISASYLQRRLRIGFPRAARLLSELELAGVIVATKGGYRAAKEETEEDISDLVNEDDGETEAGS
ncbi:MAG: FtsK/SpoIIIE family DNA translocase [Anaerolineae bacterium]